MISKNTELLTSASPALREVVAGRHFSCWEKSSPRFKLSLFSLLVEDGSELAACWEVITNSIASEFQANLDKQVEIWNIYVVFVAKQRISKELKYQIEQDKYSSRKLVFDGLGKLAWDQLLIEEALAVYLDGKLFSLTMPAFSTASSLSGSLEELLREKHHSLLKIIGNSADNNYYKIFFDKYLEDDES